MFSSVLIPTRWRSTSLIKSVLSFYALAANSQQVEVLVKVDDDDDETLAVVPELKAMGAVIVVSPRGAGYQDLHKFYNALAALSSGAWLWMFNDDSWMATQNWDALLAKHGNGDELRLVYPQVDFYGLEPGSERQADYKRTRHYDFSVMSRSLYRVLGHLSLSAANDTYHVDLARRVPGLSAYADEIVVEHGYFRDRTHPHDNLDNKAVVATHITSEIQKCLDNDARKIRLFK